MIEGNLQDISLPGLLQLLAGESTRSYRIRIKKGGQHGDMFVCEGELLVATFGILEGLDALSEFLNWSDGEFIVEKLPSHFKNTIRSNICLKLYEPGCFADQCAFLYESNVGLNTEIVPSRSFGTSEWQEALQIQPLEKEDYAILGWVTDGRTMRQAMREFQFDMKKTIGVLYRLLITRSVEVVRPTFISDQVGGEELTKLASEALAKHQDGPPRKSITVEFHATDIGGATRPVVRTPADDTATNLPAMPEPDRLNIRTSSGDGVTEPSEADRQKLQPAANASAKTGKDAVAKEKVEPTKVEPSKDDDGKKTSKDDGIKLKEVVKESEAKGAPAADKGKDGKDGQAVMDRMKDSVSSKDSSPADRADKKSNNGESIDSDDDTDSFKKRIKKSSKASITTGRDTQDMPALEALETNPHTTLNEQFDEEAEETLSEHRLLEDDENSTESNKVLNVVASAVPAPKNFDERKTDPLPLVAIDIERLLNSTFHLTNIGTLALTNPTLDELLRHILVDVERGKSLLLVLTDSNRSDASVMATYKYSLDRGYIEHSDPVMGLTVDLLIGRMELDQYLLQRRRISGDQLRDMVAITNRQGIPLEKLLVAAGYVLPQELERLRAEKDRFAAR